MTPEFNIWWDVEPLIAANPYTVNTPIYWAWEGWQAATLAERDACAKVCEEFGKTLEVDTGQNFAEEIRARTE